MSDTPPTSVNPEDQVTVVIPVKNGADTIGEQLDALSRQSFTGDVHVVISDNGSTDGLREALQNFSDCFTSFEVIDSSEHAGPSHARNEGLKRSRTEKVLFCDADDWVAYEWIESLSAGLDTYDLVGGPLHMGHINSEDIAQQQVDITEPPSIYNYLSYPVSASLGIRKSSYRAVGGFDSSYGAGHEEVDFAWRVQRAGGKFGWCPEAIVHYRQREDPRATCRQRFNYARSAILLWTRFEETGELAPVSFKGSVRNLARTALRSYKLIRPRTRRSHAMALGWTAGTVAGHLKYRRRMPPPPQLMDGYSD